jgi:hypothetical protein
MGKVAKSLGEIRNECHSSYVEKIESLSKITFLAVIIKI